MTRSSFFIRALFGPLLFSAVASAQTPAETAINRALAAARAQPALLSAMMREIPKGGDLHNHLSGGVYAETFLEWAAESGACIRTADMVSVAPPCDSARGILPAASARRDEGLRNSTIDAWSMRNWSRARESGHDHFFATFGKFSVAIRDRAGDMVAEAARLAAAERVSYLELMSTPPDGAAALGSRVGWDDDSGRMREKLMAAGLADVVTAARSSFAATIARERSLLKCGTPAAEAACAVEIRFLYQVLRGLQPEQVFAQILTAFEVASVDSLVVGFNMVMPEDGYVSMRDYSLHMRIIDDLHALYPHVNISLHAGELSPGLVPPEGMRFHIREAVVRGHAKRIGHGVDVLYEDDALALMDEMARRDVAVEICLSSNDVILNVSGTEHPLAVYRQRRVPTLLATDDPGVARSSMSLEYKKAVLEQNLDYLALKQMARNSIRYAFVQDAVKKRLLDALDAQFIAFEKKWR